MASTSLDRRVNIYINDKDAGKTIKTIGAEARKLSNELNKNLTPGTKEYYAAVNRLKELNGTLAKHRKAVSGVGDSWGKIKEQVIAFGATAMAYAGFQQLVSGIDNLIGRNADLSDSYAGVMKTTGLTQSEVQELSESFKTFNTRTPKKELLELARIAGKQGVTGFKNLKDIVKETDQVIVALGKDLGASSEDVVGMLLKLTEVYGMNDNMEMGEAIRRTGSAVNELGAKSNASEGYIVDFTKRLGGVAPLANISAQDIMGLAATFDVLGQSQEVAATAMTQFLTKIGEDVPKFAKLAGMSVGDFSKLLKENGNDAMIAVLNGAKASEGGLEALATSMGDMGAEGVRSIAVLGALSQNLDLLTAQQKLSNDAFADGTSLSKEFATNNDNLAAILERISKWFSGKFINGGVMVAFEKLARLADDFVKVPVSATLEKERIELNALVSMLVQHNGNQVRRKELIDEIQSKYPDFLKNMDTELMTTEVLTEALKNYNREMLVKITRQQYEEKIAEAVKEKLNLQEQQYQAEKEANEMAIRAAKLLGIELSANLSLEEKYDLLRSKKDKVAYRNEGELQDLLGKIKNELQNPFFTDLSDYDGLIAKQEEAIQNLIKMSQGFELNNKIEPPAWMKGPVSGLTTIDPNTKLSTTTTAPNNEISAEQKKAIQDRIDATKKMVRELEELNISMIEDDFERELTLLHHKQVLAKQDVIDSKADAKTKKAMLLAIEQRFMDDANALRNKYYELQKKEGEADIKEQERLRKEALDLEYRDLVAAAQLKILFTTEGSKKRIMAEQELILLQLNWELAQKEHTEKEKQLIEAKYIKQKEEALANHRRRQAENDNKDKGDREQAFQKQVSEFSSYIDQLGGFLNGLQGVFNAANQMRQAELDNERAMHQERMALRDSEYSSEQSKLEQGYNDKIISKQQYDTYVQELDGRHKADMQREQEALDRKAKELQTKQAKRQKAFNIAGSIIDTFRAVTTALANPPGPPFSIPQAVAAGVFGAAQTAMIAATPIPKFAKGGMTDFGTFAGGGHVNKGQLGMIGERGPEWVAPNWMLNDTGYANIIGMLEEARVNKRTFAMGGSTASGAQKPVYAAPSNTNSSVSTAKMEALLDKLITRLDEPITAHTTIGHRQIEQIDEEQTKIRKLRERGRA